VPSAYDQLRSETPEFREVDPNATAFMQDVQGLLRQGEIAKALSRVQVGLATGNYGPAGTPVGRVLGYFSDDPETAAQRAAGREATQWFNDPANEQFLLENPDLIRQAAEDPISVMARARSGELTTPPEEEAAPAEEEPGMTTGIPIYEQRIADLLPTPTETPDETGGGETDTSDIRARAEERIKLFQDLFGSDEPTARDRAMQFAMIGLAIAAGQSPNALTNIASGLLAGTQAMTAQEAERRKGAREIRSEAITSVFDELEAEREARIKDREKYQPTESYTDTLMKTINTLISEGEDPIKAAQIAEQLVNPLYGRPMLPPEGTGAAFPDDMTEEEKAAFGG